MRLWVARWLMRLPHRVWMVLPNRVRSWAIDEWMWSVASVRRRYTSRLHMKQALEQETRRADRTRRGAQ
jgi:hypothetical protein